MNDFIDMRLCQFDTFLTLTGFSGQFFNGFTALLLLCSKVDEFFINVVENLYIRFEITNEIGDDIIDMFVEWILFVIFGLSPARRGLC